MYNPRYQNTNIGQISTVGLNAFFPFTGGSSSIRKMLILYAY